MRTRATSQRMDPGVNVDVDEDTPARKTSNQVNVYSSQASVTAEELKNEAANILTGIDSNARHERLRTLATKVCRIGDSKSNSLALRLWSEGDSKVKKMLLSPQSKVRMFLTSKGIRSHRAGQHDLIVQQLKEVFRHQAHEIPGWVYETNPDYIRRFEALCNRASRSGHFQVVIQHLSRPPHTGTLSNRWLQNLRSDLDSQPFQKSDAAPDLQTSVNPLESKEPRPDLTQSNERLQCEFGGDDEDGGDDDTIGITHVRNENEGKGESFRETKSVASNEGNADMIMNHENDQDLIWHTPLEEPPPDQQEDTLMTDPNPSNSRRCAAEHEESVYCPPSAPAPRRTLCSDTLIIVDDGQQDKGTGEVSDSLGTHHLDDSKIWSSDVRLTSSIFDAVLPLITKSSAYFLVIDLDYFSDDDGESKNTDKGVQIPDCAKKIPDSVSKIYLPVAFNNHWVLARLQPRDDKIVIWNSLASIPVPDATVTQLKNLGRAIARAWGRSEEIRCDLRHCRSAQQSNSTDCGIFVFVNALYDLYDGSVPESINSAHWRKVLSVWFTSDIISGTQAMTLPLNNITTNAHREKIVRASIEELLGKEAVPFVPRKAISLLLQTHKWVLSRAIEKSIAQNLSLVKEDLRILTKVNQDGSAQALQQEFLNLKSQLTLFEAAREQYAKSLDVSWSGWSAQEARNLVGVHDKRILRFKVRYRYIRRVLEIRKPYENLLDRAINMLHELTSHMVAEMELVRESSLAQNLEIHRLLDT